MKIFKLINNTYNNKGYTVAREFEKMICTVNFSYCKACALVEWLFKLLAKNNYNKYNKTMVHVKN